ncbi:MAG: hypothetical protein ACREGG_03640 [Candidatus Saccharimonadales bacterium]
MRFNREKFREFRFKASLLAQELDEGFYKFYLKMQLYANRFWAYAWMFAKGLHRFARRHSKPIIALVLGMGDALIIKNIFEGKLNPSIYSFPALVVLILFSATIVSMIPADKRDRGVEYAALK